MQPRPLRTTVIGSYPFPGWLEFASQNLGAFGEDDIAEMQDDAVVVAIHDQLAAGLDVITDGEQTRFDFNLSFYGYLDRYRAIFLPSLIALFVTAALSLAFPYFLGKLIGLPAGSFAKALTSSTTLDVASHGTATRIAPPDGPIPHRRRPPVAR